MVRIDFSSLKGEERSQDPAIFESDLNDEIAQVVRQIDLAAENPHISLISPLDLPSISPRSPLDIP